MHIGLISRRMLPRCQVAARIPKLVLGCILGPILGRGS